MAAAATTTDTDTDTDLSPSPGAQAALERARIVLEADPDETTAAREVLEPYAAEQPIADALRNVVGVVSGGEGSEGAELSKRLAKVDGEIAELRKIESEPGASVAVEKLEAGRRDLQRAYLERHSGYPGSTTAKVDAARRAA